MESYAYSYKDPLEAFFEKFSELEIKQDIQSDPSAGQFKNWVKYAGHEVPQQYILSSKGEPVGFIREREEGWIPFSLRSAFLGGHRPSRMDVQDEDGNLILQFYRPYYLLFSTMKIWDEQDRLRGRIKQKFPFTYELYTSGNHPPFAFVSNPVGWAWTMPVLNRQKRQIAEIKKKWGGAGREFLTKADTFTVRWGHLSLEQKIVLLATVITIDFDWFERT